MNIKWFLYVSNIKWSLYIFIMKSSLPGIFDGYETVLIFSNRVVGSLYGGILVCYVQLIRGSDSGGM